ncbi:MAG: aromatic amino acid lyase, partial [Candidatus Solibacter usitatus]|nr:aromatic amino acid lyase [Candidatus Solibacter usitatus]
MVVLDGEHLDLAQVQAVALRDEQVAISDLAVGRMLRSRAVIERLASSDAAVYGVNTGFGLLADVRVPA